MATKFYAYCLVCCGGGKRLTPPVTMRAAERECTSHGNLYQHECTIIRYQPEPNIVRG